MFHFDKSFLHQKELELGHSYSKWSNEEKKDFILSLLGVQISHLDSYIQSLSENVFDSYIDVIISLGFEIIQCNSFVYTKSPNVLGNSGCEVMMFHKESGMLYYLTSCQEKNGGKKVSINRSELYFQMSNLRSSVSDEVKEVISHCSRIKYNDGSVFRMFSNVDYNIIKTLLDSCHFVKPWSSADNLGLLNEEDCFQYLDGKVVATDAESLKKLQIEKIKRMPEDVRELLGVSRKRNLINR